MTIHIKDLPKRLRKRVERQTTGYNVAKLKTTSALVEAVSAPAKNKYNAKRVAVDGITYDSKREARLLTELRRLEKAGEIRNLEIHPKYKFEINGVHIGTYTPDARYFDKRKTGYGWHVIDVKNPATARRRDFRRTMKLMKALHGVDVEVWF